MTTTLNPNPVRTVRDHEAYVAERFDALQGRFRRELGADDFRLRGLVARLGPLGGRRVLDLGCGKGRFSRHLASLGARVVGLDLSGAMLGEAEGLDRVRGSALRLPFRDGAFDVVIAVEVFEHLASCGPALDEARRVLGPGGVLAVIDKNAGSWNVRRPWLPNLVVKRIDEARGRWMYPLGGPVRERWFWPERFLASLARRFDAVGCVPMPSPAERSSRLFRAFPGACLMRLWTGRVAGGPLR